MEERSALAVAAAAWRCSPWTEAQGVDPIGSAGDYDTFIVVEVPLPWPKDISEIPELAAAASARVRTRVQAVRPDAARDPERRLVTVWHRTSNGPSRYDGFEHEIELRALVPLLEVLVDDPTASLPSSLGAPPRDLLICTHGKRDACCGRMGSRLSAEVADRWPDVRVRRCSHTGGHRFAPTAYSFPEGRAWAHLDGALLDQIIDRRADVTDLRAHQRGAAGLDPWAQVVERAVFEQLGWQWLECSSVDASVHVGDLGALVELSWQWPDGAGGSARGDVRIARDVPVLVCGEPPERAKKSEPELELAEFALDARTSHSSTEINAASAICRSNRRS